LLAGRDLGDYVEGGVEDDYHETFDAPPAEERFADLEVRPLPGFLVTEDAPAPPVPEPEPLLLDRREDEGGFDALVSQLPEVGEDVDDESITDLMRRLESGLSSRELAAEPVPSDQPVPPMVEQQPGFAQAPEPEQAPEHDFVPSWMQQQEPEAEPIPAAGHEHEPEPTFARAEEPEPAPSFEEARAPLEPVPPFAEPPRAEEPVDHQVGHRLRSTIGGLHKIAGRG
jgi:hypothetical protein